MLAMRITYAPSRLEQTVYSRRGGKPSVVQPSSSGPRVLSLFLSLNQQVKRDTDRWPGIFLMSGCDTRIVNAGQCLPCVLSARRFPTISASVMFLNLHLCDTQLTTWLRDDVTRF